jgi:hypothetical protein
VKKDKGNHDGQTDLSSNSDLVFALAMQNYNKAHKLKFKANKKQQKLLRQMDRDSDGKINSKPKEAYSPNSNKSKGKRGQKNLVRKVNAPNVVNGEAIPLRSAPLKNRRRKLRKLIWH